MPDNIKLGVAKLKILPTPDKLDCSLCQGDICLITDDGSMLTVNLANSLIKQGWQVVIVSFPESIIEEKLPLPKEVERVILSDLTEEHLKQQLNNIINSYGLIGAFIHLNPLIVTATAAKTILQHVFLVAKHLKNSLNETANKQRSWFVTVTHLDGKLGLGEDSHIEPIIGGLFGLTKTLNLEWQKVFCRAIDLNPNLDIQTAVEAIVAELFDPNLLVTEVGYTSNKRITIESASNLNA